jgi:two-component system, cell cycle sensor histidine kinase and response regulator CckA
MFTDKHRINLLVQNIITSGAFENHDIEGKRKIILINIIGIIGIINLIPFGIVAFIQNKPVLGFFDLTVASILVVVISYLRKSGYNDSLGYFAVSAAGALFLYLFIAGGVNNTGHLWFYSFPLFALFLLGSRRGAIATFVLFVPSFLLLIVGSYPPITAIYTTDFKIRFIPSFLVVFGISYFFEKLREMTQQLLAQRNAELEETITNQKETQKALRESQEKYQNLVEESFDGIFIQRGQNIIFVNKRLNEMLGYKEGELIGQNHWVVYHPDYQELTRERAQARMRGEEVVRRYEVKLQRKDGSWFYGELNARPITFPSDKESGIQVWIKDIMEQKLAEETLRESEEKYRTILESIEDGYYETDLAGNFTFFNASLCRVFGYSENELMGMNYIKNIDKETADKLYGVFNRVYKTKIPVKGFEYEVSWKGGRKRFVEISVSLLRDTWGKPMGFRGIIRDVTERKLAEDKSKRLETHLQQAQKMESIGTLAGGVAHDFNNLLMAIQGRTSLIRMNKDSSHPDFEHLKGIEAHVESAAGLTKQLLGFARGGKYEVRPTDLNKLIEKESHMFGRTKKEITIHRRYEENLWSVAVDRRQIDQVLLNLYVNAWQAMPGGGNLYLETKNVTIDESYVKPFSIEPGRYVKISVTDTGVGMDKATQERIFDPFFTTKELGRGTGLGLASVYGIIKNHGGFINVHSKKGHGTTFNIYLPASEKEVMEEKKLAGDILRGTETVLFVDDEDMIIEVTEELFEQLGYKILTARSGKEAIEIYKESKERIDIVLLDMIMPDMSGGETYDRMKDINPKVKVLLSSGYSINGQAAEILDRGCDGFIQKPFKIKELSKKLREILDEK